MTLPILYSFRRCPYAIRARMAMARAGIDWQHREVSLRHKPREMLAISGKGTVPVLQLADGSVLDESLDVMLWALQQADPDNWLKTDIDRQLYLIHENDHVFKPYLDRYKYHVRYPEHEQSRYREQGEAFLQKLESLLGENGRAGLIDNRDQLADVAIFPFVRQFAGVDRLWFENSAYKKMVSWLKAWESSEAFMSIMQKYPDWQGSQSA